MPRARVRVTDAGVAVRAGTRLPVAGTPLYLAPERWDGAPSSPATEVYAATAVFFECLTGNAPFSGNLAQLREQHDFAPVPLDRVDPPLRRFIATGMAKDPASRPRNALAFVSQLEALAANVYGPAWEERGGRHLAERAAALLSPHRDGRKGPAAAWGGHGEGRRHWARRRGAVVIAAAAVVAIGGVATAVTLTGRDHQASPADVSFGMRVTPSFQAVADVTPPVAASKCTAATTFSYAGTISATAPGTVRFQWVYSSGKPGPVQTMSFTSAGHKAVAGARVTAAKAGGGWGEIKLLSPAAHASDKAEYKLLCGSRIGSNGGVTASATVTPAHRTASCATAPPSFTVTGLIRAAKAEKVTYYWARSNGQDSAPASLAFTAPGIMPARPLTITPQAASGSGSAVLVVTSPVTAASSPAAYTLTCIPPPSPTSPTSSASDTSPTSPRWSSSHTRPTSPTSTQPATTQPTVGATTPQGLSATASVSPASQTSEQCGLYDDPTFSGTITDDQAGTVSYYWDLPTGHTPEQDLVFAAPGTQSVATEAIAPSATNVSESGRIVITSPRAVTSNDAAFTVACPYAVPPDGLAVDTSSLTPADLVGQPYSAWVTVSNGKGPYTWSDLSGLPPGLTVTPYDGLLEISGTPTQAGNFNGSVLITDSSSPALTTTADIQIFVAAQKLSAVVPSLTTCTVGQPCSFSVTVAGGDGTYTWLAMDQDLPDGLSATSNGATFTISGTPVTPGQYMLSGTVDGGQFPREPWDQAGWFVTLTINPLAR